MGFTTALNDFGAGYAGLTLLSEFQTDVIKIDMELVRNVNSSATKQAIIAGIVGIARQLNIEILGEGVETPAEIATLVSAGIRLFQGYAFAKPQLERFQTEEQLDTRLAA